MRFSVLGPVKVTAGNEPLALGGPKQRTVLAMLIADHGHPVSAGRIIDAVYGEEPHASARRTIQTYVSNLRRELGDVIVAESGGWVLETSRDSIDALRFEDLYRSVAGLEQTSPGHASAVLSEALGLWRGHPYSDVESHGGLDAEITRLNEMRVSAIGARVDADLASGRHAELIGEIEALVVEHPFQERFRAQHMIALYRSGRQKEALHSYQSIHQLLIDELGLDPTPELQDLEQRIIAQDPSLDLVPATRIEKRAVLVVDLDDSRALPNTRRSSWLEAAAVTVETAVLREAGELVGPAGTAIYSVFSDAVSAVRTAESIALRHEDMRLAVDFGDVEAGDGRFSGPPIVRAARLVAMANPGQVILAPTAHRAIASEGGRGVRMESLGEHDVVGLDGPLPVFQLLVGHPPRSFSRLRDDRVPPPLPGGGSRNVPGYELREPIGNGSVGTMYRAYQPSVGREVVVEVIGRSVSSGAEFIRRFEADLQQLSLMEHPNLLPVLDYWRDTEGAFIVYPYHRGGMLQHSLAEIDEQVLLGQVGSALAYSHSCGVIHGRLSPKRIMLDEGGNPYVFGFPVAGASALDPDEVSYLAPDSMGEEPSFADDVYALGVIARWLRTGSGADPDGPPLEPSEVTGGATSVRELLAYLLPDQKIPPEKRFTEARSPYKGLAAFHEADARDFFGRSAVVADLCERLQSFGVLAVVGPSGIGKSSVVRAGLIPALRDGAIAGSEAWLITDMYPGVQPFRELERSLERVAVDMPRHLRERLLDEDPNALAEVHQVTARGDELVLVIDQFEELFIMCPEETRSRFLDLLATASRQSRARIVLTLRADFLDRPLSYSSFGEVLGEGLVTLRSPNPSELADAVREPAEGVGVSVEPALIERIVSDVHDRPGALPLLQHALSTMFESRTSDLLSLDAYEAIGGVTGSLASRAESLYRGLDPDQRTAVKQALFRLVTVGDGGIPTRRRVKVTDLEDLHVDPAIRAFSKNRLFVYDSDPETRTPTIEVAHEALFTHWPRLEGWIEATYGDLTLARRLDESLTDWEANDRDEAYLLVGGRLEQHQAWTATTSLTLTSAETEFLQASTDNDRMLRARRRRRRGGIMAGIAASAVAAGILAVIAWTNGQAVRSRELAAASVATLDDDPELSMMLALESIRAAPATSNASASGLIALRQAMVSNRLASRVHLGSARASRTSADGELIFFTSSEERRVTAMEVGSGEVLWSYHDPTTVDSFAGIGLSPDEQLVAFSIVDQVAGEDEPVTDDQKGDDGHPSRVVILRASDGEVVQVLNSEGCFESRLSHNGFSPDGRWLAFSTGTERCQLDAEGDWVSVYDTSTWEEAHRVEVEGGIWEELAFSADSSRIVLYSAAALGAGQWRTEVRSFPDLNLIASLETAWPATLSPDGQKAVLMLKTTLTAERRPLLVDANTGERIAYLDAVDDFWVIGSDPPSFSPDGSTIAVTTRGSDYVFDADDGRLIAKLGPPGPTLSQTFVGDGSQLWTSDHSDALLWELESGLADVGAPIDPPGLNTVWFNPNSVLDGPRLAVLSLLPDALTAQGWAHLGLISVLDPQSLEVTNHIQGSGAQLPDGRFVVALESTLDDGTDRLQGPIVVWDPLSGETNDLTHCSTVASQTDQLKEVACPGGEPFYWSPLVAAVDGSFFAADSYAPIGSPKSVRIWNTDTMSVRSEFELPREYSLAAAGRNWVAHQSSGSRNTFLITDIDTGLPITEISGEQELQPWTSQSSDGLYLYTTDTLGHLTVYDTSTWELVAAWPAHNGTIRGLAISPDGTKLVTTGNDNFIKVWDMSQVGEIEAEQPPSLLDRIPAPIPSDAFWASEKSLTVFLADGAKWLNVSLNVDDLVADGKARLTRAFTLVECATYQIDDCPTSLEAMTDRY